MSTRQYWRDCLLVRRPLLGKRIPEYDYTSNPKDSWHTVVARKAWYIDYKEWCDKTGHDEEREDRFYTHLAPFIYLDGRVAKPEQVINRRVIEPRHYKGKWLDIKVSRYYVRLFEYERHLQRYENITNTTVRSELLIAS